MKRTMVVYAVLGALVALLVAPLASESGQRPEARWTPGQAGAGWIMIIKPYGTRHAVVVPGRYAGGDRCRHAARRTISVRLHGRGAEKELRDARDWSDVWCVPGGGTGAPGEGMEAAWPGGPGALHGDVVVQDAAGRAQVWGGSG